MNVILPFLAIFVLFVAVLAVIGHVKRENLTKPLKQAAVSRTALSRKQQAKEPIVRRFPEPTAASACELVASYVPDASCDDDTSSSSSDDNPNNGGGPDEYGPSPGYGGMGGP